jgi:hypothetical protein
VTNSPGTLYNHERDTMAKQVDVDAVENELKSLHIGSPLYKIAPSKYGMFISLNCDLYLRRAATLGKKYKDISTSTVSERMQVRGSLWESRLCAHLLQRCRSVNSEDYFDCTSNDNFRGFLVELLHGCTGKLVHHLYQVSVDVGQDEVPSQLQAVGATITRIIPDLLMLQREKDIWKLYVVDAKSSVHMKQSHQAQVPFSTFVAESSNSIMSLICGFNSGGVLRVFPSEDFPP